MAYEIFHVIFRTGVVAPVLAYVGPVEDFIGWVVEDPGEPGSHWQPSLSRTSGCTACSLRTGSRAGRHLQERPHHHRPRSDRRRRPGSHHRKGHWLFASIAGTVAGLWNDFMGWINSPLGWEHLLAGASVLFVPVIVLILIFAIADG
ncbi:hypothetical protein [Streptomyces sp. NPDC096311]|uniref:hypothetical protein n=1 Tax=Streptomyces sp. NPDC096311 TaxID=3366083 RepID=UPI003815E655